MARTVATSRRTRRPPNQYLRLLEWAARCINETRTLSSTWNQDARLLRMFDELLQIRREPRRRQPPRRAADGVSDQLDAKDRAVKRTIASAKKAFRGHYQYRRMLKLAAACIEHAMFADAWKIGDERLRRMVEELTQIRAEPRRWPPRQHTRSHTS